MYQVTKQIWIGGSHAGERAEDLKQNGIRYILNVAEDLPAKLGWRDEFVTFHVGLADGKNHPSLYEAALKVLEAITSNPDHRIVVHCHEGRSRSVFVAANHMVRSKIVKNLDEALSVITKAGVDAKVAKEHSESFPEPQKEKAK